MGSAHTQSPAELQKHLAEQIGFLKASAEAFDRGQESEAKRLAVTLRLLLHDTGRSRSLLGLLEQRNREFCDLSFPQEESASMLPSWRLVVLVMSPADPNAAPRYAAPLDDPPLRMVMFDEWWSDPIFQHPDSSILSRKQIVLGLANQDGGAHVDPQLDPPYARFSRENAMGAYADDRLTVPIGGITFAAARQIAHETIRTLEPSYRKKQSYPHRSAIVARISASLTPFKNGESPPLKAAPEPPSHVAGKQVWFRAGGIDPKLLVNGPTKRPKVEENDPCPCGSGLKAKSCHPEWT
jgi:hypothetical protein